MRTAPAPHAPGPAFRGAPASRARPTGAARRTPAPLAAHLVSALPPGARAGLARLLAGTERLLRLRRWRQAAEAYRLAFCTRGPGGDARLRAACTGAWLDRLEAWLARSRPARQRSVGLPIAPGRTLYLTGRIGQPRQLACAARRMGITLCDVERAPLWPQHAAPTYALGMPALRSTRAVARALARGHDLRLLLLLPAQGAYLSPSLRQGPAGPQAVLQRVLDALDTLARARPDLVDWSQRRARLRAGLERSGLPSWSRRAPWQHARAPRRRRARVLPTA